ncbi:MAG: hypothetical protein U9R75_10550 [Candidatus Thermoplasmatota archaeon]|nr:hypothetical protein [Candidatus Thermoplasmatota archaeon]
MEDGDTVRVEDMRDVTPATIGSKKKPKEVFEGEVTKVEVNVSYNKAVTHIVIYLDIGYKLTIITHDECDLCVSKKVANRLEGGEEEDAD